MKRTQNKMKWSNKNEDCTYKVLDMYIFEGRLYEDTFIGQCEYCAFDVKTYRLTSSEHKLNHTLCALVSKARYIIFKCFQTSPSHWWHKTPLVLLFS